MNQSLRTVKPIFLACSAFFLASVVSLPAKAINLVTNGGFESSSGVGHLPGPNFSPGLATTTGWTVGQTVPSSNTSASDAAFAFIVDANADSTGFPSKFSPPNIYLWGPNTPAAEGGPVNNGFTGSTNGGYFLGVDGDYAKAPIYQQINGLTPGTQYTLSFEYALGQFTGFQGDITGDWTVTFGNDTVTTPTLTASSKGFSGWQTFSQTFTATSASQTLNFLSNGTPVGQPPFLLLDGVSVEAVPWETDTLPLVGSTVIFGLGLWARNKAAQKKLK